MPYILQEDRERLLRYPLEELPEQIDNAGEMNFVISYIITKHFESNRRYQTISDVVGALEGAKLEFYRMYASPYEEVKRKANGDL